jgi:transcription elongation factor GreB
VSKAFTRESDDLPERPVLPRQASPLPPGAKNYLTTDGAARLREELERLVQVERPGLAALPDDGGARQQLPVLDQRIAYLRQSLNSAVVVPRPVEPEDRVRFGATVTVRERGGVETRYRIVGVDETDIDRGWVSWLSPIAKALLNARVGQRVRFKFPSGEEELEIAAIIYE